MLAGWRWGHEEKLRVLVDKVLSKSNAMLVTGEHMDEIRAAGFNVAVPRVGGMDLDTVHEHAALAHQRDMFYMAWIPVGELAHSALVEDQLLPANVVGANGATAPILSPNADQFWDRLTSLILGQARIAAANPAVIGTFFDFEGYAMGDVGGNYYPLSYDDVILGKFAEARKVAVPELAVRSAIPGWKARDCTKPFASFSSTTGDSVAVRCAGKWTPSTLISSSSSIPCRGRCSRSRRSFRDWPLNGLR